MLRSLCLKHKKYYEILETSISQQVNYDNSCLLKTASLIVRTRELTDKDQSLTGFVPVIIHTVFQLGSHKNKRPVSYAKGVQNQEDLNTLSLSGQS